MFTATCHCGAVVIEVPIAPTHVCDCNCSICRRYGAVWTYYPEDSVWVKAAPGATQGYVWGDRVLRFVSCATCHCLTHWDRVVPVPGSKMGINARNFPPALWANLEVEKLDGAADDD